MKLNFIDNYSKDLIIIGDRVAIAPGAIFIAVSNPNNSLLNNISEFNVVTKIIINNDAWIGANAVIFPGVKIGKFSVIGSGAIVTKDTEDYSIVAGNPAKKIDDVRNKKGFSENV